MLFGVAIVTKGKDGGSEAGKTVNKEKITREELLDILENGPERRRAVLADMGITERGSPCMGDTHFVNSCTGETLSPALQMHIAKAVVRRTVEMGQRERKEAKGSGKA
jgi:hypothetical protein